MLHVEDVDLEQLAMALENHFMDYETFFWVDPANGTIELWSEGVADEAESEGWDVDSRDGVRSDAIESHEGFRDMEKFISTLADTDCRARLTQAIDHNKPFRHFKDALHEFPEEQTQWHEFHDALMKIRAIQWLRDSGLVDPVEADAVLVQLDSGG